jgi:hypothetical protein
MRGGVLTIQELSFCKGKIIIDVQVESVSRAFLPPWSWPFWTSGLVRRLDQVRAHKLPYSSRPCDSHTVELVEWRCPVH